MKNAVALKQRIIPITISGIIERSPADLKPWPSNPRTHSERQLVKLKASIRKFGFTIPPLVDDTGTILSGHGRVDAAKALGLESIPVRVILGLTEAEKRAYVITDNKLALLSDWDNGLLKSEMEILIQEDFEIETTGFSTAEIDIMFDDAAPSDKSDPDNLQAEDIVDDVVTHEGDLWQLGHHRLLCANALHAACYTALMQGDLAQLICTDPPYNVRIDGHVCGGGMVKHKEFAMASGEMTPSEFTAFLNRAFTHMHTFAQDGAIHFIFMDWRHAREIQDAAQPLFGSPRQLCVWVKDNGGMGTFYRSQHELVFVFTTVRLNERVNRCKPRVAMDSRR